MACWVRLNPNITAVLLSLPDLARGTEVRPEINTWVRKDQLIAVVKNIFGDIVKKYYAPEDGTILPMPCALACRTAL